jgi:tRNA A-37 threonylcarbamoyl transferase component Bud32
MSSSNVINLVDDDDDESKSILSLICEKEDLYDADKVPMDSGKTAQVYRAKYKDKDVVIRIMNTKFPLQIKSNEWKEKNERFDFFNEFPHFFPHIYSWGIVSSQSIIVNRHSQSQSQSTISYKVHYEILEYIPTEDIPETKDALLSLYKFLSDFWKTGFIHGDLTIRNIRFYSGKWLFIDLDSVRYDPDNKFSFNTPNEFYCKGQTHRDHNNFTIIIDSIPQWKTITSSCKKEQTFGVSNSKKGKKNKTNKKNRVFK